MIRILKASAALLVLLLAGCSTTDVNFAPLAPTKPIERVAVAMRTMQHIPLVSVRVGEAEGLFVLDSGAEATVITHEFAARAGLAASRSSIMLVGPEKQASKPAGITRIVSFSIGGAEFSGFDVCVASMDHLMESLGQQFAGILSVRAFHGCRITLDYEEGRLVIDRSNADLPPLRLGEARLPYLLNPLCPTITANVAGMETPILIDTGSSETLSIPREQATTFPFLSNPVEGHRAAIITGLGKRDLMARLDGDVLVGPFVVTIPLVVISDGPPRMGGGLLHAFRVTFDLPHQCVELDPRFGPAFTTSGFRTLGFSLAQEGEALKVADVLPTGPAAKAGIQEGDRIESVDGVEISVLATSEWRRWRNGSRSIALRLVREGIPFDVSLTPVDLVP